MYDGFSRIKFWSSERNTGILFFLGPQLQVLAPGPNYFLTAPGPNYFFKAPNDGITFSRSPSIKNYRFTTTTNNNSLSCFFAPLNKTQPTTYSKIQFRKMSYHTPINCNVNLLAVFYMMQTESYF